MRRRESESPPSLHYRAEAIAPGSSAQWLHLLAGVDGCVPSPVIKALWVGSLVRVCDVIAWVESYSESLPIGCLVVLRHTHILQSSFVVEVLGACVRHPIGDL